jgi:hypothetical protein
MQDGCDSGLKRQEIKQQKDMSRSSYYSQPELSIYFSYSSQKGTVSFNETWNPTWH